MESKQRRSAFAICSAGLGHRADPRVLPTRSISRAPDAVRQGAHADGHVLGRRSYARHGHDDVTQIVLSGLTIDTPSRLEMPHAGGELI